MPGTAPPTRRVWQVLDFTGNMIIYWLVCVLACAAFESCSGAFSVDPYQTYTFVAIQLPFMALVLYCSQCIWNIGYHLAVLEDCTEASAELNMQIKLAKTELQRKNKFFVKEFSTKKN